MMPGLHPREERLKKRARVGAFIALSAVVTVTVLLQPGYQWVSLTVGVCSAVAVAASGDLPGGRGRPGPGEARRNRGRAGGFIASGTIIISGLFQPGWEWVPFAVGTVAVVAVTATGDLPGGRRRGSHGRGSGLSGRGRDDDDGPAGASAHRWRMLVIVSRLMPRSAGHRWLAEAESLLSEVTAARRGPAIRSYLLCAPRLAVMMWAREAQRRARPGPRRPG
jgi:hypothetical protein